MEAARLEDAVVTDEIDAGFGNECDESGHQIQWFEEHVGGAVAVGRFELVSHEPLRDTVPWLLIHSRARRAVRIRPRGSDYEMESPREPKATFDYRRLVTTG